MVSQEDSVSDMNKLKQTLLLSTAGATSRLSPGLRLGAVSHGDLTWPVRIWVRRRVSVFELFLGRRPGPAWVGWAVYVTRDSHVRAFDAAMHDGSLYAELPPWNGLCSSESGRGRTNKTCLKEDATNLYTGDDTTRHLAHHESRAAPSKLSRQRRRAQIRSTCLTRCNIHSIRMRIIAMGWPCRYT